MSEVCCQSCQHYKVSPRGAKRFLAGWCRLRRLPVHAQLVRVVWCHHWIARPPALPDLQGVDQAISASDGEQGMGAHD
ncbi:MAG: hypothetical protein ACON4T_00395 [Synechococcus sp.]